MEAIVTLARRVRARGRIGCRSRAGVGAPARRDARNRNLRSSRGDADGLAEALSARGLPVVVEEDVGYSGGGALPGRSLTARVVALRGRSPTRLARYLRENAPPVVARVARDALILDPRTLLPGERATLVDAVERAWRRTNVKAE